MRKVSLVALIWITFTLFFGESRADFRIITTTPDIRSLVETVTQGLNDYSVESLARGTQDPHYLEAKPSFMIKVNRADLVISTGLELEEGWLPNIIQGARNPKVNPGTPGFLELGPQLNPLEIPGKSVSRADGDVHPSGNPHVFLDPIRAGKAAVIIAESISKLKPDDAVRLKKNANDFKTLLETKVNEWKERIKKSGIQNVITHHKTLTYFLDRFSIKNPIFLEPKPGIPPTSSHLIEVIRVIKNQKIKLVLVENYFDAGNSKKIQSDAPEVKFVSVPVSVDGDTRIKNLTDLYENLVSIIEKSK